MFRVLGLEFREEGPKNEHIPGANTLALILSPYIT